MSTSLGSPSFAATIAQLGYSEQERTDVSDRLDDVIGYGDPDAIAAKVREHLAAGADHVEVMLPGGDFDFGVGQFEELGPALAKVSTSPADTELSCAPPPP